MLNIAGNRDYVEKMLCEKRCCEKMLVIMLTVNNGYNNV